MEGDDEVELTDLVAICPKCYNFPQLELIYDQPGKMVINCECGYQQISDIQTYLSQMRLKNKIKKYTCSEHNNNKFQFYCNTCKVHLCALCKDSGTHNTHTLITLNTNINVYAIKQSIEKSRDHLTSYLRTLLDGYIKELLAHINKIQAEANEVYIDIEESSTIAKNNQQTNENKNEVEYSFQDNLIHFDFDTGLMTHDYSDGTTQTITNYTLNGTDATTTVFRVENIDDCCVKVQLLAPNPDTTEVARDFIATNQFATINLGCVCALQCLPDIVIDCL